jgi:hypothetical protein
LLAAVGVVEMPQAEVVQEVIVHQMLLMVHQAEAQVQNQA